jgi:hypothetical protein
MNFSFIRQLQGQLADQVARNMGKQVQVRPDASAFLPSTATPAIFQPLADSVAHVEQSTDQLATAIRETGRLLSAQPPKPPSTNDFLQFRSVDHYWQSLHGSGLHPESDVAMEAASHIKFRTDEEFNAAVDKATPLIARMDELSKKTGVQATAGKGAWHYSDSTWPVVKQRLAKQGNYVSQSEWSELATLSRQVKQQLGMDTAATNPLSFKNDENLIIAGTLELAKSRYHLAKGELFPSWYNNPTPQG